jgi:hypothetical protein
MDRSPPKRKPKLYEPKYDFGSPSYLQTGKDKARTEEKFGEWVKAPATSHLVAFRLVDGRDLPRTESPATHTLSRRKDKTADVPFQAPAGKPQPSFVEVKFKPNGRFPETRYAYRFDRHADAVSAFELLTGAEHPGQVIQDYFIANGIPYKRVA